jgi:nucleoside-diphosphate-sugar epimerase
MTCSIITGATGFVGANLARRLLREGHEVHLLLRPDYSAWRIEDLRRDVQIHEVDLADSEGLSRVVSTIRPKKIFHLAAHGAYSLQTDLQCMVQTNIVGTMNLVLACLKVGFESLVNTGTSSEYGFKSHAASENELLEPNSDYAVTKASATLFCRYMARKHNINLSTLRLYSVYGPYEEPTRLVPALLVQGQKGKLPQLANPMAAHDFVYVEDACEAYVLASQKSSHRFGAVYNVGTGKQTTLRQVVEIARRVMDISAQPEWDSMPGRLWDTENWCADPGKIQAELGWFPQHTFEQGFSQTVNWFENNPAMAELYRRLCRGSQK